jgi:hypothetical protein
MEQSYPRGRLPITRGHRASEGLKLTNATTKDSTRRLLFVVVIFVVVGALCLALLLSHSSPIPGVSLNEAHVSSSGLNANANTANANNFNRRQFRFNAERDLYTRRREENARAYIDLYSREPAVALNRFIADNPAAARGGEAAIEPRAGPIPSFAESKARLPSPVWEGHQTAIDCYWDTWEIVPNLSLSLSLSAVRARVRVLWECGLISCACGASGLSQHQVSGNGERLCGRLHRHCVQRLSLHVGLGLHPPLCQVCT